MSRAINLSAAEGDQLDRQIAELTAKRAAIKAKGQTDVSLILAELKHSRFTIPSLNVIWIKPSRAMAAVLTKDVGSQDSFTISLTGGVSLHISDYGVSLDGKVDKDVISGLKWLAKQGVPREAITIDANFDGSKYYELCLKRANKERAQAERMVEEAFA